MRGGKISVFLLAWLTLSLPASAQVRTFTSNVNGWLVYTGSHKVSPKWGVHLEAQIRRHDVVKSWQQLFLRAGVNYHFNEHVFATAGYAFAETYPYGEFHVSHRFPEHRIWEQLQIRQYLGRSEWIHRFRLEQRFVRVPLTHDSEEPFVYSNRMRYMHRVSIPIGAREISPGKYYVSFFDEVMIAFGKEVRFNVFNQNRAYMGFGYCLPGRGRLEMGYMNQLDFKGDGVRVENNHTIQLSLSSPLAFYGRKKPLPVPGPPR